MGSQSSIELWRDRVIAQKRSGETKESYCARRGFGVSTFYRWCRRFADEQSQPAFVQVLQAPVAVPTPSDHIAEIHLPSGPIVRCPVGSDVAWLRELASALSPC